MTQSPSPQSQLLQVYPQCGLYVSFCCGWAVIAAGMLFGRVGPQISWLRGLHMIALSLLKRGTGPLATGSEALLWLLWTCCGWGLTLWSSSCFGGATDAGRGHLLGGVGWKLLWRGPLGWVCWTGENTLGEHLGGSICLTKMMESNRNGMCQCEARQVEREQKKTAPTSASVTKKVLSDPCHSITLPKLVSWSPCLTQAVFKLLVLCQDPVWVCADSSGAESWFSTALWLSLI